jgi:hypothetical protein
MFNHGWTRISEKFQIHSVSHISTPVFAKVAARREAHRRKCKKSGLSGLRHEGDGEMNRTMGLTPFWFGSQTAAAPCFVLWQQIGHKPDAEAVMRLSAFPRTEALSLPRPR